MNINLKRLVCSFLDCKNEKNWDALVLWKDKRVPSQHVAFLNFYYYNILPTKETEKRHVFVSVCEKCNVEKLVFLLRNISFDIYPTNAALFAACRVDNLEIVKLLCYLFPYSPKSRYKEYLMKALASSMKQTTYFLLDHIFGKCKITRKEAMELLEAIIEESNVPLLRWLLRNHKFECSPAFECRVSRALEKGNIQILRLLCETGLVKKQMIKTTNFIFLAAPIIQYLCETFHLDQHDIVLSFETDYLPSGKKFVHFESIQYLCTTFCDGKMKNRIKKKRSKIIRFAAVEHNFRTCHDMITKFREDRKITCSIRKLFIEALGFSVPFAKYLHHQFHFTKKNFEGQLLFVIDDLALLFLYEEDLISLCDIPTIFQIACMKDKWKTVHFLLQHEFVKNDFHLGDVSGCNLQMFHCLSHLFGSKKLIESMERLPIDLALVHHLVEYYPDLYTKEKIKEDLYYSTKLWTVDKLNIHVLIYILDAFEVKRNDFSEKFWWMFLWALLHEKQVDIMNLLCKRFDLKVPQREDDGVFISIENSRCIFDTWGLSIPKCVQEVRKFGPQHKDFDLVADLFVDKKEEMCLRLDTYYLKFLTKPKKVKESRNSLTLFVSWFLSETVKG